MRRLGFILILLFATSCDTTVAPTPIKIFIDTSIKESPIDGRWAGIIRDDFLETWRARIEIGPDGNKRILKGDIDVTNHATNNTQPFPIQKTDDDGVIVHADLSWYALVYLTSLWSMRGRLIHPDTMEINIAGEWPRGTVHKLHRATSWPKK